MNKSAAIAAGVVIVVGALATGGAWYTGQQLPGVLNESIAKGNQELTKAFASSQYKGNIQLESLESGLFSSTAHYRTTFQALDENGQPHTLEMKFVDRIEHGPLPLSRLASLKLLPVMAVSNLEVEKTPDTEKWFAMSNGKVPFTGRGSIGYDRSLNGHFEFAPLQYKDSDGEFAFSGLSFDTEASGDAEKLKVTGNMDNLQLNVQSPDGPVALQAKGMSFDSGGTKGKAGFYLGHSNVKIDQLVFQPVGRPAVQLEQFTNTNLMQEDADKLAAQVNYDIGKLSYSGKEIGAAHLGLRFGNLDVAATRSLYQLFQEKIVPAQQAAAAAEEPLELNLSAADQALLDAEMRKLLAGKPHIELEKFSLKTANGESHAHLSIDLADPGDFDQPQDELVSKSLSQLSARVVLSKPMIQDIVGLQASLQGVTDPKEIAEQGKAVSEMAAVMAQGMQLAKVEGDEIVSTLQYANDSVDFNGQKMTPEQFMTFVMANSGMLGAQ
ncbi:YdgA family protein [Pseudomonas sp. DTU_2021_1001937_2_SI_NGA_ILE_001]|uniref:YdgA family protein n=1 Tax=Pseudomonas sp. DTU_2021_1001937_2_SI_NGA_ILE_001 TaxID=3077589 RepID=UPI0028FC0DBC|nr:YdgA family protein [Pseudomonas sp. DTU_2021_1001937_2_SI_NGA_ILE_001]WNW12487.1 YdgA family protein [Pseudomonas sp. DTU_2021_1001937_2_SI_NGA_ILE_001]